MGEKRAQLASTEESCQASRVFVVCLFVNKKHMERVWDFGDIGQQFPTPCVFLRTLT